MDRAIDIKRRAQRCIQSGDLDGALAEYEKLVAVDATDPYSYVLLADLLYKKGDRENASKRYLTAASCYEQAGLYKNAIAVGKKMMRLSLSPSQVLERLASLHALDGLATEAGLYYIEFAERLVRESRMQDAATALRKAFDTSPDAIKALERLAEVHTLEDDNPAAARALAEAAAAYARAGRLADAERCRGRAEHLKPGAIAEFEHQGVPSPPAGAGDTGDLDDSGPRMPSLEFPYQGGRPGASGSSEFPGLETHRPPRFMPPSEAPLPSMEVDRHSHTPVPGANGAPLEPPESLEPASESAIDDAGAEFPTTPPTSLEDAERLLTLAQTEFRSGDRERAVRLLDLAAQGYEALDRMDHAASIYRSICKGAHATDEAVARWLANCEKRGDRREAAQVACELGDRAIQGGDLDRARSWFERAADLDPNNMVARRRLDRLNEASAPPEASPSASLASSTTPPAAAAEPSEGKVEVAVDRGQAVTFDFASMLAEFQRGVETQLSGDAQGHYDLAMAYREMGLVEQAIESFRLAASDARFRLRGAEMIGQCLLEEGRFEEASHELTQALAHATLEPESAVGLRFQLGLALEAAGSPHEALAEFERVFDSQSSYPGVAQKIRDLRKNLEAA